MPKYLGPQSRDHIRGRTLGEGLLCLKRLSDSRVWSHCGCTAPVRRRRESVGRRQDQLATERACTKRNWSHRDLLPTILTSRCATSSIGERPGYLEHITVWEMFPLISIFFCYHTDPHNSGQQPDDGIDPRDNRLELEVLRCLCKVKELLQESFVHWRQKVKCTNVASADFLRWSKIFVARAHLWHAVNYWTELSKYCQSRKCLITQRSPIQQVLFANDGNRLDGPAYCKGDCPYNNCFTNDCNQLDGPASYKEDCPHHNFAC